MDMIDCPSCGKEMERGPLACIHCAYPFHGDPADEHRAQNYRAEMQAREAREWAETLPPPAPKLSAKTSGVAHPDASGEAMTLFGWIFLLVGAGLLAVGFTADVSVSYTTSYGNGSTVNLAALSRRSEYLTSGFVLGCIAVLMVLSGAVMHKLEEIRVAILNNRREAPLD